MASNNLFSDQLKNNLADVASTYALPAILATLGTGAVGGLLARRNKIPMESKAARRRRILRSIFFPAITTAGSLAALGGAKAFLDTDTNAIDAPSGVHPIDFTLKHGLIPLGGALGVAKALKPTVTYPLSSKTIFEKGKMPGQDKTYKEAFKELLTEKQELVKNKATIQNQLAALFKAKDRKKNSIITLDDLSKRNFNELHNILNGDPDLLNDINNVYKSDETRGKAIMDTFAKKFEDFNKSENEFKKEIQNIRARNTKAPLLSFHDTDEAIIDAYEGGKSSISKLLKRISERLPKVKIKKAPIAATTLGTVGLVGGAIADSLVDKAIY